MSKKDIYKSIDFEIMTKDHDDQNVWGIFNMSTKNDKTLIDLQGHVIAPEELQKAAHNFVMFSRVAGESHKTMGVGKLIDSIMMTKEIAGAMQSALEKVGVENPVIAPNAEFWFGGFHIDKAETWALVKEGKFDAFSIGGFARHEEVDVEE